MASEASAEIRRQAFLQAAREGFFDSGYAGTTMSSIAARVGGSKTTLWTYFPSKQALFAAVVDDIISAYDEALAIELVPEQNIEATLRRFARRLMQMLLSSDMLSLYRLVIAEATRFPDLAELFYDRGPRPGKARLAAYMEEMMRRNVLKPGDATLAVRQFVGLCQSGSYQLALLNLPGSAAVAGDIDDAEIDDAVDSFLRSWSADQPAAHDGAPDQG